MWERNYVLWSIENTGEIFPSLGEALGAASPEIRADRDIIYRAVQKSWGAIQFASDELRNDKELALIAVYNNWPVLQYLGDNFRDDKDIVLASCSGRNKNLEFASKRLQDDKDVVIACTKDGNWNNLFYASSRLKMDKDIVLMLIKEQPYYIKNSPLYNNKDFWIEAMKVNSGVFEYLGIRVQSDPEIIKLLNNK